jgi:hypothetical protein
MKRMFSNGEQKKQNNSEKIDFEELSSTGIRRPCESPFFRSPRDSVGQQRRFDDVEARLSKTACVLGALKYSCRVQNETSSAPEKSVALWRGQAGTSQWWTSMRRSWKPGMGSQ